MARVQMPVIASHQQRALLVGLFLLLLWPVASLIDGWQWALFLPCWLAGLCLALRSTTLLSGVLVWDGEWLEWGGIRYQLGTGSRILPGVLRLQLLAGEKRPFSLWLFSDALAPEHYRTLARAIHLAPPH